MDRKSKYPDTSVFKFYNANPKGRITGDCVYRAVSTGLDADYNVTVMEMAELHCKTGYCATDSKGIDLYLQRKGLVKHKQPRKSDGTKYTGKEFCEKIAEKGKRYVCNIGGHHVVAVVDKKIYDIWNSSGKTIGNYWCLPSKNER